MGDIVVPLDMVEIDGFGDAGHLIEVSEIAGEMRVVDDAADIAFEMSVIHGVEPDQGHEESPIGLHESCAEEIATLAEPGIQLDV